eukprot:GFUD01045242.1.p1 GENE.GFUD01045242.1~~GFUD01045242.1.p1  ORF type:complete len:380 (+),score=69.60 GFUD01045242.1:280-1419(+)
MKMLTPDHTTTKLGSKDFVFQVNKWPFSITCNPLLPIITESFIDLALVKDMKIPMKKVECRNMSYGGHQTRVVGSISQTVQVVNDGVPSGTMHLKAKVLRHLTNLFGVDCIAGQKLFNSLTRPDSMSDFTNKSVDTSEAVVVTAEEDSVDESITYNFDDSPKTQKRKRRKRLSVGNISITESMTSSPSLTSSPKASSASLEISPEVQISNTCLHSSHYTGQTSPTKRRPVPPVQSRQDLPPQTQNPTRLQLDDLIFCGHHPPCRCVDALRPHQLELLPPHYPVYLPVGHLPCSPDCGSHHVHGDNLHPPDPSLCPCDPPRLHPRIVMIQRVHLPPQAIPVQPVQHEDAPLPTDFRPCGYSCEYQVCQCLRQYEGRDFAS